ncbi:DUF2149 domain-containing protein [Halosquirtibacter laminarini]|uniref:DUF2149 domain-containing protein n=1 Tax=Halosquirtibacter laminarini TaxID=3374600 RepID=A0AC61NG26_9BACT|nr:DUF2149 domain-containing protein [Prolixibacteraceae bacterium]
MRRRQRFNENDDFDPMATVSNLFDVAMVFALALMVALVGRYNMTEVFSKEDFTMVKNPGKDNMEIITRKGENIERYKGSSQGNDEANKGKRVGSAYQMNDGSIVYIPDI